MNQMAKRLNYFRAWRWVLAALILVQGATFALDLLTHRRLLALVPVTMAVALVGAICLNAKTIARLEYQNRPRPDYAHIARMEREIYGQEFNHAGVMAAATLLPRRGRHRLHPHPRRYRHSPSGHS